jgi:exonuclease SbcD
VALGHIHRAFPPEPPRVWYSGTPIPVGFTETEPRRVLLVEVGTETEGGARVKPVVVPEFRKLVRLAGGPDEVFAALAGGFGVSSLPPMVDVTVRVDHYEPNLRQTLKTTLDAMAARGEVVPVLAAFRQQARAEAPTGLDIEQVSAHTLRPEDIFEKAWLNEHHSPPPDAIRAAFASLWSDIDNAS